MGMYVFFLGKWTVNLNETRFKAWSRCKICQNVSFFFLEFVIGWKCFFFFGQNNCFLCLSVFLLVFYERYCITTIFHAWKNVGFNRESENFMLSHGMWIRELLLRRWKENVKIESIKWLGGGKVNSRFR